MLKSMNGSSLNVIVLRRHLTSCDDNMKCYIFFLGRFLVYEYMANGSLKDHLHGMSVSSTDSFVISFLPPCTSQKK